MTPSRFLVSTQVESRILGFEAGERTDDIGDFVEYFAKLNTNALRKKKLAGSKLYERSVLLALIKCDGNRVMLVHVPPPFNGCPSTSFYDLK